MDYTVNVSHYLKENVLFHSKHNIAKVTAELAGRVKSVAEWRSAREQTGRLEVLLAHLKNLGSVNSASALDEKLASQRTKRHLSGPSSKYEILQKLKSEEGDDVCWRNICDVKLANNASIRNIRKGLAMTRKKVVEVREKVLYGLSVEDVRILSLGIQILVDRLKGKEMKRLNVTRQRLVDKNRDCQSHYVCKWMRQRIKEWQKDHKTSDDPKEFSSDHDHNVTINDQTRVGM